MRFHTRCAGFTLVELMIAVIVLAVLASLAAPSFSGAIDRARLKSQVTGVVDVLEFAKSEAMKRSSVTVTITDSTNSNWSVSAVAVYPADPDNPPNPPSETKEVAYDPDNGVTMPSGSGVLSLTFRGVATGAAVNNVMTLQSPKGKQVQITINAIGGIRVCGVGGSIWSYPSC